MNSSTRKFNYIIAGSCAALVSGSILLAAAQPACANKNELNNFRTFRDLNADIDRHSARKIFQSERRNGNIGIPSAPPVNFSWGQTQSPSVRHGYTNIPRFDRHESLAASPLRKHSVQASEVGRLIKLNHGINLDLSSQLKNITLGKNLFSDQLQSIEITAGGKTQTVTSGSQVTAAEYVAVKQILSGGGQKVSIDRSGTAIGGEVDLSALTSENDVMRASDLVIPENVTTYGDFGKGSDFKLLGDLNNYGTVHVTSTDTNIKGGAIRADDIANHSGALISSSVNLTLDAAKRLSNNGTILSQQGLTLSAGESIDNAGLVSSSSDLNLNAGSIRNSGHLQSIAGNVTLDAPATSALAVSNTGGAIEALNGAINVRSTAYSGAFDSSVHGGDLLSRELNLHSGQGLASVAVEDLTGTVNQTGTAAHVLASTDLLTVGNICLTGDPTYYNAAGSINIIGNVVVSEALTFVAAGDIAVTGTNVFIGADNGAQGFDITFIAGADFVNTFGGSNSPTVPPLPGTPGAVSLSGKASKLGGGSILMTGANTVIDATAITPNQAGGDVTMVAFGGKAPNSGVIDLSGTIIQVGGTGTGINGSVLLIAGAKSGDAVRTGLIETGGGVNSGVPGQEGVNIVTSQPVSSIKNSPVEYGADGTLSSAAQFTATLKLNNANIVINDANPGAGLDISTTGNSLFYAGGLLTINGDMQLGDASLIADGGIQMAPSAAPIISTGIFLRSEGDIGAGDPIEINAPLFAAETSKGVVNIRNVASGSVVADFITAGDLINIETPNAELSTNGDLSADKIALLADSLGFFSIEGANDLSITTTNGAFPLEGAFTDLESLTLNIAGGVGITGSPFVISGVKTLQVTAEDDVFLQVNDKKATNVQVNADEVNINATGSLNFVGESFANFGQFNVETTSGTLTIAGNITGRRNINLTNTSIKGKMVIEGGSELVTNAGSKGSDIGDINITVGPGGQPAPCRHSVEHHNR